jgi:chromosome segregation ATPase
LAQTQNELARLGERITNDTLEHRNAADRWLSEKAALHEQGEELRRQLQQSQAESGGLVKRLAEEQGRRTQTEAELAEQREAAQADRQAFQRERAQAEAVTRQQSAALGRAEAKAQSLQSDLDRTQDAGQRLEGDLQRTIADLNVAAASSNQNAQTATTALDQLRRREYELAALQTSFAQLHQTFRQLRQEADLLRSTNQTLTARSQQLEKQVADLKLQIQKLTAELERLRQGRVGPTDPARKSDLPPGR